MSSTLLLMSSSLSRTFRSMTEDHPTNYKFVYCDSTKHPWESNSTQDWTHLFPKEYPYTSLREGQTFQLKDGLHDKETFKVTTLKEGYRMGQGKYYWVWFIKI